MRHGLKIVALAAGCAVPCAIPILAPAAAGFGLFGATWGWLAGLGVPAAALGAVWFLWRRRERSCGTSSGSACGAGCGTREASQRLPEAA